MCCLVAPMCMCVSVCAFGGPRAEEQRLVVCLRSLAPWDTGMQCNATGARLLTNGFHFRLRGTSFVEASYALDKRILFLFLGTNFGRRACHGQALRLT